MNTIILCENKKFIDYVYSTEQINLLKSKAGLKSICTLEDIKKGNFTDTDYIFSTWGMPNMQESEIQQFLPNLKCVFYAAGTVQAFARPFLNCGVKIFSAWAANAVPVAEYTVAQILLANKGYFPCAALYSKGNVKQSMEKFSEFPGNYGETVGIIGAGMIGKLVIKLLKNFNLKVLVFDPFLSDMEAETLGVEKCGLNELFEKSFVVSNHLANNKQTKGILNYNLFSKMRPNAVFLNTGRGAQVVEDDLIRILKERTDLTAVLDVTEPEPPISESELYKLSNCILTPHIAGSSGREVHRMANYMINEFLNYVSDKPTKYEVTKEMLKTMA